MEPVNVYQEIRKVCWDRLADEVYEQTSTAASNKIDINTCYKVYDVIESSIRNSIMQRFYEEINE